MSAHTQLALAVLGATLTAAAAGYYAWHRGRELHREMDDVLHHIKRFETHLLGDQDDPRDSGELGRQARNLERLRLIVEDLEPYSVRHPEPFDGPEYGPQHDDDKHLARLKADVAAYEAAHPDLPDPKAELERPPAPEPDDLPPPTARMPVVAALIPTTAAPPTGPADIPATDGNGDPPQQPSARAYSLTGPRPRPPGAHRPPKEREA